MANSSSPRSLTRFFNINTGEERLVGVLLALSICVSLARLFNSTAASTLFLVKFNAAILPYTYMLMPVIVPVIGLINTRLGRRVPFVRLMLYNLLGYVLVLAALRLAIALTEAGWPVFVYYIWSEVGWIVMNLMLWGLAGRLLTVRQGKRLFGLIGAGGGLAAIAAGFFMAEIVRRIHAPNLMIVVIMAQAAAIGLLIHVLRSTSGVLVESAAEQDQPASPSTWKIPVRYVQLLIGMAMLAEASFYFVDIIFFKQVQIQFTSQSRLANYPTAEARKELNLVSIPKSSEADLAGFLGVYLSVMNLGALLSNLFLVTPLIGKFGMRLGLVIMPAVTGLIALVFAAGGLLLAPAGFLFGVATLNSVVDWVLRDTIFRSAVLILYQPLPPVQRSFTQNQVESIAMPIAQGITGLVLAGLGFLAFSNLQINWILLLLLAACSVFAVTIGRSYTAVLIEALSRRALKLNGQSLILDDPATRAALLRELHSPYPEAALYALNTLEGMQFPLEQELIALLRHPAPVVRREALLHTARTKPRGALQAVKILLEGEQNPLVRAAGFQALSQLAGGQVPEEIEADLNSADPTLFVGAMLSLMSRGDRPDLRLRLDALLRSPDPAERKTGLQIVSELETPGSFEPLVLGLFQDLDPDIRREALWAAAELGSPPLLAAILHSFNDPGVHLTAVEALSSSGGPVLPLIREALLASVTPRSVRIGCLRVLARMRPRDAIPDILPYLDAGDVDFRQQALIALHRCGYRFDTRNLERFRATLTLEMADAVQTASLQSELEAMGTPMLLHDGLETAWARHKDRLFLLLRMLYDPALIMRVKDNLALDSREKRAYAMEVLEHLLAAEYEPLVFPLLEDVTLERRLEMWSRSFPALGIDALSGSEALLDLPADHSSESRTPWLKSCVIQAYAREPRLKEKMAAMADADPWVRNTLRWARGRKEMDMLSIIERVLILKTVSIFGDTPDHLLAEVGDLLEEQHLAGEETFIRKGEPATCMYIIVEGEVRIHDGGQTFNTLGAREIVGEMAVLDPAPRSASVTTLVPTHLLKLDRTPLFELMADRPEVAQGMIKVLAGRLRQVLSSAGR